MTQVTDTEKTLLRSHPQDCRLWLSIYEPKTVFSAKVDITGSYAGLRDIPYTDVITGSHSNVESGMTVYFGTEEGEDDVAKLRIRSADADSILVAENSMNLQDGYYITVKDFFEVWPIYHRIVTDPDDDENIIIYKDYDIEYDDQNDDNGSFVCMGSHYAGFIDPSTDEARVYYTSTGTFNVNGCDPLTYLWEFEGGTPTGSVSATPGWVTYSTPGHYTTKLTVYSSGTDDSYRHVSIYDKPGHGTNVPILSWGIKELKGDRSQGGYRSEFWIREEVKSLVDGALVVIFAEDVYDGTEQSIGGNCENRSEIVFVGYIAENSISYNYQDSVYEFEVVSHTEIMKKYEGFAIAVDSVSTSDAWYEMPDMDVGKALYHFFRWHTTVPKVSDIVFAGLTGVNTEFQNFDTNMDTLFDSVNEFLTDSIVGTCCADRQGRTYLEREPSVIHNATGSIIPLGMELSTRDWMDNPTLSERLYKDTAYLEMGGFYKYGNLNTPLLASAPGESPDYGGKINNEIQGLILTGQGQLNEIVGDYYAYLNSRYPGLIMSLAGNYRNVDIAPIERYLITIDSDDTQNDVEFDQRPFHVVEVTYSYDPKDAILFPEVAMHEITSGITGTTEIIPQPVEESYQYQPPDIDFPAFPNFPLPKLGRPLFPEKFLPTYPGEDVDCPSDTSFPPNGPFPLGINGVMEGNRASRRAVSNFPCWVRSAGHTHNTQYTLNGKFYKRATPEDDWEETLEDDWYDIYAIDDSGNRLITATKNPVEGSGRTRSGLFLPAASTLVRGFEIYINEPGSLGAGCSIGVVSYNKGGGNNAVLDNGTQECHHTDQGIVYSCSGARVRGKWFDGEIRFYLSPIDSYLLKWFETISYSCNGYVDTSIQPSTYFLYTQNRAVMDGTGGQYYSGNTYWTYPGTSTKTYSHVRDVYSWYSFDPSGINQSMWLSTRTSCKGPVGVSDTPGQIVINATATIVYANTRKIVIDNAHIWNICNVSHGDWIKYIM